MIVLGGCKEDTAPANNGGQSQPNETPKKSNLNPDPNEASYPLFKFASASGGEAQVHVKTGDKFILQRDTNPTTGYTWELEGSLPDCVQLVSRKTLPGPKRPSGFVGGGSNEQLFFLARSACTGKIQYVHKQSWMPTKAEDVRIILHLSIESS